MSKIAITALMTVAAITTAQAVHGAMAYALTDDNQLLSFETSAPANTLSANSIRTSANQPIQDLIGIDFRPSNGSLYGVGRFGQIYTIDPTTGIATAGQTLAADPADLTNPFTNLSGSRYGFDFNPVANRLRITSDSDISLRVNVDTGLVTTDTALNPGNPNVTGSAYTNNASNATSTTLYDIDTFTNSLLIQNPPNDGTLTSVGLLGVDVSNLGGFDITYDGGNLAFAVMQVANSGVSQLYSINLGTGSATLVDTVGGGDLIDGFAIYADPNNLIPEPASLGLITAGSLLLGRRRRA